MCIVQRNIKQNTTSRLMLRKSLSQLLSMSTIFCIFLLGVFWPILAMDFHEGGNYAGGGQRTFPKNLRPREPGNAEKSLILDHSHVSKRSGQLCKDLLGIDASLKNHTNTFTFNVRNMRSLSLAWVGDGTGVLLVLTTFQVPMILMRFGQSNLFRSEDYGKTFQDVTHLINHTFVQTEFGIAIGPDHSGKVILTGDVSEFGGSRLFRSQDFGLSFAPTDLPFEPLIQVLYNPEDCNVLLALSVTLELWLSEDFGATWSKLYDSVCLVRWGPKNTIYFTTSVNGSCNDKGTLQLRRTRDYGRSLHTIATRIYSFVLGGRFLFASVMTGTGTARIIHVSVDGGDVWNVAQLPTVNHEQFYSILAANQDMVFMHVDDPGDHGTGTIFVSDSTGTVFSKSLERHLHTYIGSDTDFLAITSLRGVYMTSILTEESVVDTVITFDQGATWQTINRISNGDCELDGTANWPDRCRLHIHASYSTAMKMNVPMLPLSQPNAVGLVIAHGSVDNAESLLLPDVYVSNDGGYSWLLALSGPHHYVILDSGGLLVAVEHTSSPVHQIKFSTDEGQCWHLYNFTDDPFHFSGMDSEPGSRSMNVSLWGYRSDFSKWVVITIDFRKLLNRDCGEQDYVQWLANSVNPSDPGDGCILGYKERFLRLRKDSVCRNGRDFVITKQPTACPCTLDDYHCDYGYYRAEGSSECVEQEDMKEHPLELCLNGSIELLQSSGYRKIPGDLCEGGFQPERKEIDLRKMCTSNALYPNSLTENHSSNTALIVLVVIVILLSSAVGSVWLVKKYVCGGRFLVHRYSVMKEHVEANGIEEVEDLEAQPMETGRTNYCEDSDQDLLE